MSLDGAMGKLARKVIRQFGRSCVVVRKGDGFYDHSLGRDTRDEIERIPCHAAITSYGEREIDGTLIQQGDRRALVSRQALGYEPTPMADTLIEGGRTWLIVRLSAFSSGSQEAAYELQLRRAPDEPEAA